MLAVHDMETAQIFHAFHPCFLGLLKSLKICPAHRSEHLQMALLVGGILRLEVIQDVTDTQSVAAHFVGIGRPDTLAGGAHLVFALGSLKRAVENAMGRHDQVSLIRDVQARLKLVSALGQLLGLAHKEVGGQHHAIADDIDLATLENSGGNAAEHIFLALEFQGVAGIGSTLKAGNHVIVGREYVYDLTLALISPLKT